MGCVVPLHPDRRRRIRRRAADGVARGHRSAVPHGTRADALQARRSRRAVAPACVAVVRRRRAELGRAVLPVRVCGIDTVGRRDVGDQRDDAAVGRARRVPVAEGQTVVAARARPRDRFCRRADARVGSGRQRARRDRRHRHRAGRGSRARRDAAVRHRGQLHEAQAQRRRSARQRDRQHDRLDGAAGAVRDRDVACRGDRRPCVGRGARARHRLHRRRVFHLLLPDRAHRSGPCDHGDVRDPRLRPAVGCAVPRRTRVDRDDRGLRDRARRHRARDRRDQTDSGLRPARRRGGLSGVRLTPAPRAGVAFASGVSLIRTARSYRYTRSTHPHKAVTMHRVLLRPPARVTVSGRRARDRLADRRRASST
ncbi:putative Glutamate N-acetyltransferase @ N-acetylglutamate synthase [Burkholderia vietnamiensis]